MIRLLRTDPIAELLEPSSNGGTASELTELVLALRDLGTVRPPADLASEQMAAMRATTVARGAPVAEPSRTPRLRRAALAGLGVPLAASGIAVAAVAGVDLPDPAADAFESIGIDLPNQSQPPADGPDAPPVAVPVDRPGKPGAGAGKALGHDKGAGSDRGGKAGDRGKADPKGGKGNDHAPPGHSGTTPGNSGSAPGQTGLTPGQSSSGVGPPGNPPATSNGSNGNGPAVTPPGHGGSPPGQATAPAAPSPPQSNQGGGSASAPGQTGTTPAETGTPPGQGGTPPGQSK